MTAVSKAPLEGIDCSICLEPVMQKTTDDQKNITELKCHHFFHKECIQKWLKIKQTCPNCRESASLEDTTKPFIILKKIPNNILVVPDTSFHVHSTHDTVRQPRHDAIRHPNILRLLEAIRNIWSSFVFFLNNFIFRLLG